MPRFEQMGHGFNKNSLEVNQNGVWGLFPWFAGSETAMAFAERNEWRLLQLEHHAHETGQLCGVLMVQALGYSRTSLLGSFLRVYFEHI